MFILSVISRLKFVYGFTHFGFWCYKFETAAPPPPKGGTKTKIQTANHTVCRDGTLLLIQEEIKSVMCYRLCKRRVYTFGSV